MKLPFVIDLSDKIVAITGGGGVLMREFAVALSECGASIAVLDINEEEAKKTAILCKCGISIKTDCMSKDSLLEARTIIEKKFGKVNFIINGAGGNSPHGTCDNEVMTRDISGLKTFFDLDIKGLRFVFDLNIMTAFLTTQVFAEGMVETGGNIINISSMNAFKPLTKIPAYSAAKAGVSNFTQWLAVHFAPCGIRVNAIAPGFFVTKQNSELLYNNKGEPTARTNKILTHTPLRRFGEVDDLMGTLLWLASDKASGFVTGSIIAVDGGFAAYSGV